jgi:hypothetical protein
MTSRSSANFSPISVFPTQLTPVKNMRIGYFAYDILLARTNRNPMQLSADRADMTV